MRRWGRFRGRVHTRGASEVENASEARFRGNGGKRKGEAAEHERRQAQEQRGG